MEMTELMVFSKDLGLKKVKTVGHNVQSHCPFHNNNSHTFGISMDEPHAYNCFACNEGKGRSLETLVMRLQNKTLKGALQIIRNYDPQFMPMQTKKRKRKIDLAVLEERTLYPFPPAYHKYIKNRGYKKSTVDTCGLKFDKRTNYVIIPVRDFSGKLVGIVRRTVDDTKPKDERYDNSPGPWKETSLIGAHLLSKDRSVLYLVEGAFDWMRMIDGDYHNCLALIGSKMSVIQQLKIAGLNFKKIMLCFDKDTAGWKCLNDCYQRLKQYCPIVRLDYENFPYPDLGKADTVELQQLLKPVAMKRKFETR